MSDVTLDIRKNTMRVHKKHVEKWKVTLIDTGLNTHTGGRLKKISKYLGNDKNFCFTYGDGLSDINITESIKFHKKHKKLITISAVQAPGRYGSIDCDGNKVKSFVEKPKGDNAFINGGFLVVSKNALKFIEGDKTSWEEETIKILALKNHVMAFKHRGFWYAMDTLRDKNYLQSLCRQSANVSLLAVENN